jgi:DNA-binding transcriptional MerR regulator
MKMQRRLIRIGELAKQLKVENFVIRFWEKEFSLKGQRSPGGQRFYDTVDLAKFIMIKELLYDKGFTIAGAKKALKQPNASTILASHKTTMEEEKTIEASIEQQMILLQKKLIKLRELL